MMETGSLERMRVFRFCPEVRAKEEALEEEIIYLLTAHSNEKQSYNEAIKTVQNWLALLILEMPEKRDWIRNIAERAGQKFLAKVNQAKLQDKIKKGELPISVSVKQD